MNSIGDNPSLFLRGLLGAVLLFSWQAIYFGALDWEIGGYSIGPPEALIFEKDHSGYSCNPAYKRHSDGPIFGLILLPPHLVDRFLLRKSFWEDTLAQFGTEPPPPPPMIPLTP